MQTKICSGCKQEKVLSEFFKESKGILGVRGKCKNCDKPRLMEYRNNNRELLRQKDREKYWSMSEEEKSKFIKNKSLQNQVRFKTSPEALQKKKLYHKSDKGKFSQYKGDAKRRNYEFSLTFEQFSELINKECHYCPTIPARGIDRVDNTQGYIPSNCVSCCSKCNEMKMDKSVQEFYSHIEKIYHKKTQKLSKV
jgi:hypothetical protein